MILADWRQRREIKGMEGYINSLYLSIKIVFAPIPYGQICDNREVGWEEKCMETCCAW